MKVDFTCEKCGASFAIEQPRASASEPHPCPNCLAECRPAWIPAVQEKAA